MTELKTSNGLKVPKISKLQIVEKRIPSNEQRNDGDLTDLSISSSEMLSEIPVKSAMRPSSLGTVTLPTAMVNERCNKLFYSNYFIILFDFKDSDENHMRYFCNY
jgi:hypothetical protein